MNRSGVRFCAPRTERNLRISHSAITRIVGGRGSQPRGGKVFLTNPSTRRVDLLGYAVPPLISLWLGLGPCQVDVHSAGVSRR